MEAIPEEVTDVKGTLVRGGTQRGSAVPQKDIYAWDDGGCYEGEWKDDLPHG